MLNSSENPSVQCSAVPHPEMKAGLGKQAGKGNGGDFGTSQCCSDMMISQGVAQGEGPSGGPH